MRFFGFVFLLHLSLTATGQETLRVPTEGAKWVYSYQSWVGEYHDGEVHTYWVEEGDSAYVREGDTLFYVKDLMREKEGDTIHIGFMETTPNGAICFSALKGLGNGTCAWYAPMVGVGADMSDDGDKVYLIDSILMNGMYRKRWHTLYDNVILEGVGSLNRMPIHYPYVGSVHAELLCFSVHDSLIYQSPEYKTCDTSWRINLSNSKLSANEGKAQFFQSQNGWKVHIPDEWMNELLTFELFDLNGKRLHTLKLRGEVSHVTNAGLDTGMYVYRIYSASQEFETGKLVNP